MHRADRDRGPPAAAGDGPQGGRGAPCKAERGPDRERRAAAPTDGLDLVSGVTATTSSTFGQGPRRIVAFDFGVKATMVRHLAEMGTVTVVPAGTTADEVRALEPDGVFYSLIVRLPDATARFIGAVP